MKFASLTDIHVCAWMYNYAVLTFDMVHQCDDFLGKRPSVHGGLTVRPRVLQHGQEVQTLATHVDQV